MDDTVKLSIKKNILAPFILIFILPIVLVYVLIKNNKISKKVLPNFTSLIFVLILGIIGYLSISLSSTTFIGPKNVDGDIPVYADNGFLFWTIIVICISTLCLLSKNFVNVFTTNFVPFIITCLLFGLALVLYIYNRDKEDYFDKDKDEEQEVSPIFKFYRGLKFHSKLDNIDIKQWTNCRFGMIAWQIIILIFFFYVYHKNGFNLAIFVSVILQTIYIGKFFYWETGYFNTLDITLDRVGYYICWGCIVFVPAFYTLSTYYLANNPKNISEKIGVIILLLGVSFILINYLIDKQKEDFKKDSNIYIWGKKAEYISTTKGSNLLTSGFWGISRHLNYVFEILLSICWCIPGVNLSRNSIIPLLYSVYIIILLTHRIFRDEDKCKNKYGKDWEKYCEKVPYRLIPKIF